MEFIGRIGLTIERKFHRAEIGYWIAEPFWGQGFAKEATQAIIGFGFSNLNLNKLTSSHMHKNQASGRVLGRCGMRKEGALKQHLFKNGEYHDLIVYGPTREDFEG